MSEITFTLRDPPSSYIQLESVTQSAIQSAVDDITFKQYIVNALSQYLGITGTAITVDILKTEANRALIRIPHGDESAVTAAVSQWSGRGGVTLRILSRGSWLAGVAQDQDHHKLWSLEP